MSISWSPLKVWTPKSFTIANFRHPLSKSWLRPCYAVIVFQSVFNAIDHHWKEPMFATTGDVVEIWNEERTEPVRSFTWGVDSINSLKFNPIEVRRYPSS